MRLGPGGRGRRHGALWLTRAVVLVTGITIAATAAAQDPHAGMHDMDMSSR